MRFVLREEPGQRLDLSPLTPDRLAGLSMAAVEALDLHTTRSRVSVADIFGVHAGDAAHLVIKGGSARFDGVGEGMTAGVIEVEGDVGQRAGRGMAGGRLAILGHAGDWTASGLRGGTVEVAGDVGAYLGGPLAGERTGMRGGLVMVRGRAGKRAADRLRRGTVIVEGDAGEHAGSGMVAGTLVVGGTSGPMPGILMRRGTIVLGAAPELSPSFVAAARVELVFSALLARSLASLSERAAACVAAANLRHAGDMAVRGNGELFVPG